MTDLFVMCPECGLRTKLASQQVTDEEGKCKHRQNPVNCPMLEPVLSRVRQSIQRMDGSGQHSGC